MLNRTSFSQNMTTGLQATPSAPLTGIRWQPLVDALQLPTTMRGFLVFLLGLLVLAGAMAIHVTLSAEMMRLQLRLDELQGMEARVERQNANLLWQISRHADLQTLHEEALSLGYRPVEDRIYVVQPQAAPALESSPIGQYKTEDPTDVAGPSTLSQHSWRQRVEEWRAWLGGLFDVENWQRTILGN